MVPGYGAAKAGLVQLTPLQAKHMSAALGVPDRHHGFGCWAKSPGDALVIRFRPPLCDYWIFQLCNMWQENLDNYEEGQGYVTKYRARYEVDGAVNVVIADQDPAVGGNWLDPGGHVQGGMSLRIILADSPPPAVTVFCVSALDLERTGFSMLNPELGVVSGDVVE